MDEDKAPQAYGKAVDDFSELFKLDELQDCVIPRFQRIKVLILLITAKDDSGHFEDSRLQAEALWFFARQSYAVGASEPIENALAELRKSLDFLKAAVDPGKEEIQGEGSMMDVEKKNTDETGEERGVDEKGQDYSDELKPGEPDSFVHVHDAVTATTLPGEGLMGSFVEVHAAPVGPKEIKDGSGPQESFCLV